MNWDTFADVAQIVGTILVIVALFCVARRIEQATQQRRVDSYRAILDEVEDSSKLLAQDNSMADIWWRASKGLENLTDAERVRYFAILSILFRSWEKVLHYRAEEDFDDWSVGGMAKTAADFTASRGVQEYWAMRKRWYTTEFQEWVDNTIKERKGVDVYGDQFRIFGTAEKKEGHDQDQD